MPHYVPDLLGFLLLRDKKWSRQRKHNNYLFAWLQRKTIANTSDNQHVVLSLYEPLTLQPSQDKTNPPPPPPPWCNYFYHSAEKPVQTSPPAIICMQVSPVWKRAKGICCAFGVQSASVDMPITPVKAKVDVELWCPGSRQMIWNESIMSQAGGKHPDSLSSQRNHCFKMLKKTNHIKENTVHCC